MIGEELYSWAKDLWPYNRSVTGSGVRQTLNYLKNILPELEIKSVKTGYKAFDWEVPKEWIITDAYIKDSKGNKVVDFRNNNLHVVGYSIPVDKMLSLEELDNHLYSSKEQPNVIPYVTSYYKERWGFCLSHNQRLSLKSDQYHVVIKSDLVEGVLNYGELLVKGNIEKEIFISTYICHPSMANNELSGPVVATAIGRYVSELSNRKYSYRLVFIPETIGSLVYISKNLDILKKNVFAGFNLTCIGDELCYSYLPSRNGNTISDRVVKYVLKNIDSEYKKYTWMDRGSDERQYCSPGIDLPIASIMRSKYAEYPEYHTSADNLEFITANGLAGGFLAVKKCIDVLESNEYYRTTVMGEPQLGKRGLYPTISKKGIANNARILVDVFSYCDGAYSVLDIAELLELPLEEVFHIISILVSNKLIDKVEYSCEMLRQN